MEVLLCTLGGGVPEAQLSPNFMVKTLFQYRHCFKTSRQTDQHAYNMHRSHKCNTNPFHLTP